MLGTRFEIIAPCVCFNTCNTIGASIPTPDLHRAHRRDLSTLFAPAPPEAPAPAGRTNQRCNLHYLNCLRPPNLPRQARLTEHQHQHHCSRQAIALVRQRSDISQQRSASTQLDFHASNAIVVAALTSNRRHMVVANPSRRFFHPDVHGYNAFDVSMCREFALPIASLLRGKYDIMC